MSEDNLEKRVTDLQNTVNNQSGQIAGVERENRVLRGRLEKALEDIEGLKAQVSQIGG